MLEVRLICVGKLKEDYLKDAYAEYEKRLRPFCRLTLFEVPESRLPDSPSKAQIDSALLEEGRGIISKCKGRTVPLTVEGRELSSPEFSSLLARYMENPGCASFVIGSSYGLSSEVKTLGEGISFSRMTFPHQLMRVIFMEQLYRGFEILSGGKYHK